MIGETRVHKDELVVGSNRNFGFVFAAFFTLIGLLPLLAGKMPHFLPLTVAAVILALALFCADVLAAPNRLWMRFGLLLHKVISPLAMGVVFFGVFMPMGLLMRLCGKRPLVLGLDKSADTYWVKKEQGQPYAETMIRQF